MKTFAITLKKKVSIIFIMLLFCAFSALSNSTDPSSTDDSDSLIALSDTLINEDFISETTAIDIDSLGFYKEENEKLKSNIDSINDQIKIKDDLIKNLNEQIILLGKQLETKDNEIKDKDLIIAETDSALMRTVQNFIYIPYATKYTITVAKKDFEMVQSKELKDKHKIFDTLLTKYNDHIVELLAYLKEINVELTEMKLMRDKPEDMVKRLKDLNVYKDYKDYKYWPNTYLGKKITDTIDKINKIGSEQVTDAFKDEIQELELILINAKKAEKK